jgi:hypothetical protein
VYDGKGLARLADTVSSGKNLNVPGFRTGGRLEDWYERWAEVLDLGFMPGDSTGASVVLCASCGYMCDEGDWMSMAQHFVGKKCEKYVIDEPLRWRTRHYIGMRIRQARLEIGVPKELLDMRRRVVFLRCGLLKDDEVEKLFSWLEKEGCRVGKIGG